MPKGINHLKAHLPRFLEDATNELSVPARRYFLGLSEELDEISIQIKSVDCELLGLNKQNNVCQQLSTMTGIGLIIATAFYAGIGDGKAFNSGRHVSAWLGLVPGQHTTGGKPTLLGIYKRDNTYLRTQLINGERAALKHCENKTDQVSIWSRQVKARSNFNNATVALANKMARMAWAMLHHQEDYKFKSVAN